MTPKDMVVFLDGENIEEQQQRIAYAAVLAERWQAHLVAIYVADRLELNRYAGFARGEAAGFMLRDHKLRVEAAAESAKRVFEEIGQRNDLSIEWRVSDGEYGEALMLHARHSSLAVVGPSQCRARKPTALSLSEDVIFASGRPSLLLPVDWPGEGMGRRIVVGWNGSREATRAIADAMPLLAAAQAVHVVVVPEQKVRSVLGADPGADITKHLARHGVPVALDQIEGPDAGAILLDRARETNADMIVMGAYGQPKITEFVFGSATRTLLESIELPMFLSR